MRFENKNILITGGSSGIGFAAAKRVVSEGGTVVITGRDVAKLERATRELGPRAIGIKADVSVAPELDRLFNEVSAKLGKLDGLFVNAGIMKPTPVGQTAGDVFDELINTNVKGLFFTVQKAVPHLRAGASIVLNASVLANKGMPGVGVYSATKAAVRSLSRTFSAELLASGIRVNTLSPGATDTEIWGTSSPERDGTTDAIAQTLPMRRMGRPEEIAAGAAFLLSSDSSYMAGADLVIDGGAAQL